MGRVALVEVNPALHDDDGDFTKQASDNAAGVAGNGRLREVGNLGVGDEDTAPRPDPRTMPMRGTSEPSLAFKKAAASETWSK
jgi:hypothetical protein